MIAVAVAELLAMSLWFSASAVVPQLTEQWQLDSGQQSWLTVSVQLGFVFGAVVLAVTNLADRMPVHRLLQYSALAGAVANGAIAWLRPSFGLVLLLRFATGACLAGVYPPAMKLMVSWFQTRRGVAIGVLVGATTVGSALPHLFNVLPLFANSGGVPSWPAVLLTASAAALMAVLVVGLWVRPGPFLPPSASFDWRQSLRGFSDPALRKANLGYLGHMWELYAMWTWVPLFILQSYRAAGIGEPAARIAGFAVIAVGGLGCVIAGVAADRLGRTMVTSVSMIVSASCALLAGFLGASPVVLTALCLVWGFAVVADSAQFSAAASELCDPAYVGTALTTQTAAGFLLTTLTIRLVPSAAAQVGWGTAFALLAVGPLLGVVAMLRLRSLPEAAKLAGGRR